MTADETRALIAAEKRNPALQENAMTAPDTPPAERRTLAAREAAEDAVAAFIAERKAWPIANAIAAEVADKTAAQYEISQGSDSHTTLMKRAGKAAFASLTAPQPPASSRRERISTAVLLVMLATEWDRDVTPAERAAWALEEADALIAALDGGEA